MKTSNILAFLVVAITPTAALAQPGAPPALPPPESAPAAPEAPPAAAPAPEAAPAAESGPPESAPPRPAPVTLDGTSYQGGAAEREQAQSGPGRVDGLKITGGVRVGYLPARGFDTFASNDVLASFALEGTYAFWSSGRLALGAGLGWDVGGRSSELRGLDANLTVHRFTVPLEARVNVLPWLWGVGRVAPGAALLLTSVEDGSSPGELSDSAWAFAADASVGPAFVLGRTPPGKRTARFVLLPEIGYSVSTSARPRLGPGRDEEDQLGTDSRASLRPLALSGLFWRVGLGVTF